MASVRPTVSVYALNKLEVVKSLPLPAVFRSPLRPDLVCFVADRLRKNSRQPTGVKRHAGYQTCAESWGTGRAVARVPRVSGGGTHRAGQGAYANMCRGGGMAFPLKVWRRWHRPIPIGQRRHALASAIAGSGLAVLAESHGHVVGDCPEFPLVLDQQLESLKKTKDAVRALLNLGLGKEMAKVSDSRRLRPGQGKSRNRRYIMKKGALIVYEKDDGITRAFRNISGITLCKVDNLSVLDLAPGGMMGRLCIWSAGAFARLSQLFGDIDSTEYAPLKTGYHLPRPTMTNSDFTRFMYSELVLRHSRVPIPPPTKQGLAPNPLKSLAAYTVLNPAAPELAQRQKQLGDKTSALRRSVYGDAAVPPIKNAARAAKRARIEQALAAHAGAATKARGSDSEDE